MAARLAERQHTHSTPVVDVDFACADEKPNAPSARCLQQRDRILCAAKSCFISEGFHAASMSRIADAAGISAGLIYRYFDSKNAIVRAIIERQADEHHDNIANLHSGSQLVERLGELFVAWREGDPSVTSAALLLEMSAEASRDAEINRAVAQADQSCNADMVAWLQRQARKQGVEVDDAELQARALALFAFIEGLAIRAVREPEHDPQRLDLAIRHVVEPLLDLGRGLRPS